LEYWKVIFVDRCLDSQRYHSVWSNMSCSICSLIFRSPPKNQWESRRTLCQSIESGRMFTLFTSLWSLCISSLVPNKCIILHPIIPLLSV
jgi:hypothetical protein